MSEGGRWEVGARSREIGGVETEGGGCGWDLGKGREWGQGWEGGRYENLNGVVDRTETTGMGARDRAGRDSGVKGIGGKWVRE